MKLRMEMKKFSLAIVTLLLIMGCATPWVEVGGLYKDYTHNFSVELPTGWLKSSISQNYLFITKDGANLQLINIEIIRTDQPLKYTKKRFNKGMLPQEVAEVILDLNSTGVNPNISNFEIVENKPVNISGYQGFYMIWISKDNNTGLKYKRVLYGFMSGEQVYLIRYKAP